MSSESRATNSPIGASAGADVSFSSTAIDRSSPKGVLAALCRLRYPRSETATGETSGSPFRVQTDYGGPSGPGTP